MPYIKQSKREELNSKMSLLLSDVSNLSDGDLNYIISNLLNTYIEYKKENGTFNYSACNTVIGVECAKIEFYNRLITPYENIKIAENGSLYKEQSNDISILKSEYKKVKDEIRASEVIYSYHGCDSYEDLFRDNIPLLKEKLEGIKISIEEKLGCIYEDLEN